MLDPYTNYNGIFVEITKSEHGHGGPGWEFGTCLWSPTRNQAGHDRYALMREPVRGSLVLHAYHDHWPEGATETRICGRSIVSSPTKRSLKNHRRRVAGLGCLLTTGSIWEGMSSLQPHCPSLGFSTTTVGIFATT